jgi:hypothetical protein
LPACTSKKSNIEIAATLQDVEIVSMDSVIIPFTLKNNRIIVKGKIGENVYDFLLDNCAPRSYIDKTIFYSYYDVTKLTRLKSQWKYTEEFVYPFLIHLENYDHQFDTVYVEKTANVKYANIIGTEFFLNSIIEIDFRNYMIIRRNILPDNVQKEYYCLELLAPEINETGTEYLRRWAKIPSFLNKENQEISGTFWADLGNQTTFLTESFAEKIDIDLSKSNTNSLLATFLSEPLLIEGVNLTLQVQDKNGNIMPEIDDWCRYMQQDGAIGVEFFKQFSVFFDYPNNKLYLKKYE